MAAFPSASPSPAISASTWRMASLRAALTTLRPSPAGRLRSSFAPAAAATAASVGCLGSFSGLAPVSNLLSLGAGKGILLTSLKLVDQHILQCASCGGGSDSKNGEMGQILQLRTENSSFEQRLFSVDARGRIVAMRHGRRVPKLNRPPDQRKALLRGLTTQLLKHGRIKTTRPRAKAMRKYVEKMITLAKDGSLHKRRQALAFIYEKHVVHALFAEVADRYGEREGGYTRIIPTFPRRGDNAPMAYIELV
ncbi:hypothetical protein HU200_029932 [Digitaria exilis]|uniref:Large ribosomal subunit protein bL17c n=1 Tax=Digitaria exilis TaxID=1010633 RepID=A0A835C0R3_9POAL|nr:hypothetical protein HU200_029932 [Digitaria exilis]